MSRTSHFIVAVLALCGFAPVGPVAAADPILKQAEAERPAFMETWQQLVDIDTGTGDKEGLAHVEGILVDRLKALGADVAVEPAAAGVAGNNIVATLKGSGDRNFLLMVHYDTVFGEGEAAARPFRVENDRAYGPGVADAKGGLATIVHALAILKALDFDGYGTLTVLFNPDEEKGSTGSRDKIAELAKQQDYVFSYEPPDSDAVTVATNGINYVFLDVKGRSSHAGSAPEEGRNAIIELAHQLLQLNDLGDADKGTTVNWTIVHGGAKRNIIPEVASAEGDMRYSDIGEYDRVLNEAQGIVEDHLIPDTTVEFRIQQGRPPLPKNPASMALAERAQDIYRQTGHDLDAIAMRFGTDAGYAYVPDSETPAVLETMGIVGGGLHSPDEFADATSVVPRLYLSARMIMDLSRSNEGVARP
ncbi:MAG: M20/M25/M40 family metallo-hydrolase [Rhodospirillales bacterium]|nr:M20/M25/M40 family metallo-hydrolase [Rhodospirillales bacterium]